MLTIGCRAGKQVGVMYGVVVKYRRQMDLNRDMFQRGNCLHVRVAVTVISLLKTVKIRQSYEITKGL
jgi:hypothetical protein